MLHACCSLLTGAQAEGRREGPRPVGIEASAAAPPRRGDRLRARCQRRAARTDPGGGSRGLQRRGEETAPPAGTTRRAVHGGATGGGDPRVRLTGCGPRAAAVDAVTPGVYRPRGLDGCVATFKKRPENSWSSRPGSVSCSHFEQLVDELNLLPNIRTVQAPRLPLPDHVHGLVSLDRAPSCAGSPAGRWSPRR